MNNRGIPATWELLPLKELGQWSGGGTPSKAKPEYWEKGKIPWVSPKDMKTERITDSEDHITKAAVEESTAKLISAGSVLIVTRSGILSHTLPVAVTTVPVTVNQDLKALTPKDGVLPEYVAWALRCFARKILNTCSKQGTTVASVETAALHRFEIPLAPLDQQKHIVAEIEKQFSRLDEAVANLKRVKANLKRYKAAVLKAAVEGRLVETEAELARHEGRNYETGAQLLQRILETRRSQWKGKGKYKEPAAPDTTDLPELPEEWVWVSAEQISDFITKGTTPAATKLSEGIGEVQFLKVYNLTFDGSLNYTYKPAYVSRKTHEGELARSKVLAGDVLINIVGPPLGQVSVVPPTLPEANINQAIARFRSIKPLSSEFLSLTLRTEDIMRWAIRRAKTTAGQSNLTLELCRALPIPLPPTIEQARIFAEVDRRLSLVREVEVQVDTNLQRAERLRQSVLASAFWQTNGVQRDKVVTSRGVM